MICKCRMEGYDDFSKFFIPVEFLFYFIVEIK